MRLELTNPLALLLIPVFLLLLGLCLYWSRAKRSKKIGRSLALHAAVGVLLILSLGGVQIQWGTRSVTTVYLVDLSDSARFYQESAEEFIRQAMEAMPERDSAAVVGFGAESRVERFVGRDREFRRFGSLPGGQATNLEEAVSTALALLPADAAKRIVLITDGLENTGSLENTVSSLAGAQVDVKAVQVLREETGEVYLNSLDVPSKISMGDRFSINVEVISNRSTTATLYLYTQNRIAAQSQVELSPGSNHFVFEDTQRESGLITYRATIDPLEDTETANNVYYAYTNIEAPPQILVIEGSPQNAAEFEGVLAAGNINFKTVGAGQAPATMDKLLEYKSVVLVDVHYDDLAREFCSLIESYVKDYAGGLIAIGGANSFALGNYRDTPLETVLPVSMSLTGENQVPPIAMALVIDRSGSMSGGDGRASKLALAREAAKRALDELRDLDLVGVVSFDDSHYWTGKFQSAAGREEIKEAISGIAEGGGTSIYPALKAAVDEIITQDAPLRHIILLTDGQDGFQDYGELLEELNAYGVTLSTVSVGEDADTQILEYLAEKGGGRYYHTDIRTNIPRIFAQEVYLSARAYLVNRQFTPIAGGSHDILKATELRELPPMLGYVASTPKSYANVLLSSDTGDPILSVWQYGLGRTVAFNSDVENRWTGQYAQWEPYPTLWKNIIDFTTADLAESSGTVRVEADGASAAVTFRTDSYGAGTSVSALYTHEDGSTGEFELYPQSPGIYRGVFPAAETGVYAINVRQAENDAVTGALNAVYMAQYSPEYRFSGSYNVLPYFLERVSGRLIQAPREVFEGEIQMVRSRLPIANFLLVLALLVFVFDIADRRINRRRPEKKKASASQPAEPAQIQIQAAPSAAPPHGLDTEEAPPPASPSPSHWPEPPPGKTAKKRAQKEKDAAVLNTNELLSRKRARNTKK